MAAAIRPIQAVHRHLNSVVTGMLMSVFAFPMDNLVSMPRDWIARRRASRLAAAWSVTHCKAYASYWGHAARIDRHQSPIRIVLGIRGPRWHWFHSSSTRKALGNWPDQDDQQDLSGRFLVRDGETFVLLMAKHPPVEEPYPRTFVTEHTGLEESPLHGSWRLTTDGSSTDGSGGWAFVIQPPAMPISKAWIRRCAILGRCTNIRAEICACVAALKAMHQILRIEPDAEFVLRSDSMHVIGMLQGEFESNANLGDVRELFTAWEKVWRHTRLVHVRAHKGDPANELAD